MKKLFTLFLVGIMLVVMISCEQPSNKNYFGDSTYTSSRPAQSTKNWESIISMMKARELYVSPLYPSVDGSYMVIKGTLTNHSDYVIQNVKIQVSFYDDSGRYLFNKTTYLNNGRLVYPGDEVSFKMSIPKDYSIKSCHGSVSDFDFV